MTERGFSYHKGELAVQERVGVRAKAESLHLGVRDTLSPEAQLQLTIVPTVVLAAATDDGACWITVLAGAPGFVEPTDTVLRINAAPAPDDPIGIRQAGDQVGLLAIDFTARRRLRVNGRITRWDNESVEVAVEEAFGNCARHIHPRTVLPLGCGGTVSRTRLAALDQEQIDLVRTADTLFIGSCQPDGTADASHRGGPPGFVHVAAPDRLVVPDYSGNNKFNTLGNITVSPSVGLVFWRPSGRTLQVTGSAFIDYEPDVTMDARRAIVLTVDSVVDSLWEHDTATTSAPIHDHVTRPLDHD